MIPAHYRSKAILEPIVILATRFFITTGVPGKVPYSTFFVLYQSLLTGTNLVVSKIALSFDCVDEQLFTGGSSIHIMNAQ